MSKIQLLQISLIALGVGVVLGLDFYFVIKFVDVWECTTLGRWLVMNLGYRWLSVLVLIAIADVVCEGYIYTFYKRFRHGK